VGGCTPNNNTAKNKDVAPPSINTLEKNNDMKENDNTKNNITNENITKDTTDGDLYQRTTKIADEVAKIEGIKSANVVISDERALIGVDIENTAEGKITDELKSKVESTAKKADKEIK
ncbi:YhcN/YlaJ family sporulation lipoprotein, partial [Escherichia coli]|nr:YhcN/YlaJ family sporulation lipoprotein [Escherichia coli]